MSIGSAVIVAVHRYREIALPPSFVGHGGRVIGRSQPGGKQSSQTIDRITRPPVVWGLCLKHQQRPLGAVRGPHRQHPPVLLAQRQCTRLASHARAFSHRLSRRRFGLRAVPSTQCDGMAVGHLGIGLSELVDCFRSVGLRPRDAKVDFAQLVRQLFAQLRSAVAQ